MNQLVTDVNEAHPARERGFAVTTYGVRIAIHGSESLALRRITDSLPPPWRFIRTRSIQRVYSFVVPRRRGIHVLYRDIAEIARGTKLGEILDAFESDVQLFVAERAPRHVFLHAGVVGWRGRAILLPGRSMSGKSTLVAELIRSGATYYSDEYAVLDAAGRVHPYARPLQLRKRSNSRHSRSCDEAAAGVQHRALPVGLVVLSTYRPGARWQPRMLTAAQGALALLDQAVGARHAPARVLAVIGEVAKRARFLCGPRGEAVETAPLVLARG